MQLRKSGTYSNPEKTFRQEALNKPGEVGPETEIPEAHQNAVLPRSVVSFLEVKENVSDVFFFLMKAFLINVWKRTRWSNVLWFFLKPHCFSERPCDSRDHMRRALIILFVVLQKQLVNAIGLKLPGSEWSLLGLPMEITTASRHENSQIPTRGYKLLKGRIEQNMGGVSKVGSGPGPNRWLNRLLSVTIPSIQPLKNRWYSSFLEEKSRCPFSFNILILWNWSE